MQAGDNLTAIAKKLGVTDPAALAQANHLKDPDRLQVGQVLNLPGKYRHREPAARSRAVAAAAKPAASRARGLAAAVSSHPGRRQLVSASWYGAQLHGQLMANGQPFNMYADTVAHKHLPLGTQLTLTNPQNGNAVRVKVTDRGPHVRAGAWTSPIVRPAKLGVLKNGVAKVWMEGS